MRNLEVPGEAAKRVPEEVRSASPEIPLRRPAGLRDVLPHDYFGIDDEILWDGVSVEVPKLAMLVERLARES